MMDAISILRNISIAGVETREIPRFSRTRAFPPKKQVDASGAWL